MENLYRFGIGDYEAEEDFYFEKLKKKFDCERVCLEYGVPDYYGCEIAEIISKSQYLEQTFHIRDDKHPDGYELITDLELKLPSGTIEEISLDERDIEDGWWDDDAKKFLKFDCEVGNKIEFARQYSYDVVAPLGADLSSRTRKLHWSGYIITAPFEAIKEFLGEKTGIYLTIANVTRPALKNYLDFEIGSCSSIEY